jgi:hypothetical protein
MITNRLYWFEASAICFFKDIISTANPPQKHTILTYCFAIEAFIPSNKMQDT